MWMKMHGGNNQYVEATKCSSKPTNELISLDYQTYYCALLTQNHAGATKIAI